jgi:hypothetical protein
VSKDHRFYGAFKFMAFDKQDRGIGFVIGPPTNDHIEEERMKKILVVAAILGTSLFAHAGVDLDIQLVLGRVAGYRGGSQDSEVQFSARRLEAASERALWEAQRNSYSYGNPYTRPSCLVDELQRLVNQARNYRFLVERNCQSLYNTEQAFRDLKLTIDQVSRAIERENVSFGVLQSVRFVQNEASSLERFYCRDDRRDDGYGRDRRDDGYGRDRDRRDDDRGRDRYPRRWPR